MRYGSISLRRSGRNFHSRYAPRQDHLPADPTPHDKHDAISLGSRAVVVSLHIHAAGLIHDQIRAFGHKQDRIHIRGIGDPLFVVGLASTSVSFTS